MLTIFTAQVDVKLNHKLPAELHRSTKNPHRTLKYELIPFPRQLSDELTRLSDGKGV